MNQDIHSWVNTAGIVVIALVMLVGGQSADNFGATGTRFPNGLSTNSTSPAVGELQTTTLEVDSTSVFEAGVTMNTTLAVTGAATLSSTLGVTSTTSLSSSLAIGSSTPGALNGNVLILDNPSRNATSTLFIRSNNGTKGGCIQLEGTASTTFRIYATTTNVNATLGTGFLIVEEGTCQ